MTHEQDLRDMFNRGVLYGLQYLRDDLRGKLRGIEQDIEKVERALSDPLADETPYELWLDEEEERRLETGIANFKVAHILRNLGS